MISKEKLIAHFPQGKLFGILLRAANDKTAWFFLIFFFFCNSFFSQISVQDSALVVSGDAMVYVHYEPEIVENPSPDNAVVSKKLAKNEKKKLKSPEKPLAEKKPQKNFKQPENPRFLFIPFGSDLEVTFMVKNSSSGCVSNSFQFVNLGTEISFFTTYLISSEKKLSYSSVHINEYKAADFRNRPPPFS